MRPALLAALVGVASLSLLLGHHSSPAYPPVRSVDPCTTTDASAGYCSAMAWQRAGEPATTPPVKHTKDPTADAWYTPAPPPATSGKGSKGTSARQAQSKAYNRTSTTTQTRTTYRPGKAPTQTRSVTVRQTQVVKTPTSAPAGP